MARKLIIGASSGAVAIAIMILIFTGLRGTAPTQTLENPVVSENANATKLRVVAAENFWGSLVSQLGGDRVQVLSVVSDPNADPHEYESNNADARAISDANLLIVNGAGYDDWAIKLDQAGNHPNQKVLNVADLLGKSRGDNPHFWYNPAFVNQTLHEMYTNLIALDPNDNVYFGQQYAKLNQSLGEYNNRISEIKHQFGGTRVAATEDIFEYLANASGLELVSPQDFMQAVAEGNDPSAQSITQFQQLLLSGNVRLLVYNEQTVTPLTQNMKSSATQKAIPIVGITETIQPANLSFQDWMNSELKSLQTALKSTPQG